MAELHCFKPIFRRMIDAKKRGRVGGRLDGPQRKIPNGMSVRDNFEIGDYVSWNSEAGRVSGTIVRVHTRDFDVKGYTHHASADVPQYEIKSSKTGHIAFHKGSALTTLRGRRPSAKRDQ